MRLRPLRSLDPVVSWRWKAVWSTSVAFSERDLSPKAVLGGVARGILVLVPDEIRSNAATERLLLGLRLLIAGLGLVGAASRLFEAGLGLGVVGVGTGGIAGRLVEGEVGRMAMARRAGGELLSVLALGSAWGKLLNRRLLVLRWLRRAFRRWVSLSGGLVAHYGRWAVSRTNGCMCGLRLTRGRGRGVARGGVDRGKGAVRLGPREF